MDRIYKCFLEEGVENLYIYARVTKGSHSAEVTIVDKHTAIARISKDGEVIFEAKEEKGNTNVYGDKSLLNVKDILYFADEVEIDDVRDVIGRQIRMNKAISDEGLKNPYGAEVGRTLLNIYGDDIKVRARARAAAGSDARMNGCSMPVVINSGSGNQGMTCSLPVVEFAESLNLSEEKMYRALVVSNLISIHQKKYIGSLSAYCGAVSAACGAGAAITYLHGGDYQMISKTITNTLANVGGIVCDGAKSSCAAKIASAVEAAIMAHFLGGENHCFQPGDGIVKNNVEDTIRNIGYIGKIGMKSTDITILNLMIDKIVDV
jgi:L-cysteine desulfidase